MLGIFFVTRSLSRGTMPQASNPLIIFDVCTQETIFFKRDGNTAFGKLPVGFSNHKSRRMLAHFNYIPLKIVTSKGWHRFVECGIKVMNLRQVNLYLIMIY